MQLSVSPAEASNEDLGANSSMKAAGRLVVVLKTLGRFASEGATFTDICREADMGKSTTHRLLAALVNEGLVYQELHSKRYRLGSAMTLLAGSAVVQTYAHACKHALEEIARISGDTVFASTIEASGAVCIARATGSFPIRTLVLNVGDRRPLGVGAGSLALLAALDDAAVQRVIDANRKWMQDYPYFQQETLAESIRATRANGYASMRGHIVPGICGVGHAVRDSHGRPICALSISAISDRMEPERMRTLGALLREQADEVGALVTSLQA